MRHDPLAYLGQELDALKEQKLYRNCAFSRMNRRHTRRSTIGRS
jgi:hypothetical protein